MNKVYFIICLLISTIAFAEEENPSPTTNTPEALQINNLYEQATNMYRSGAFDKSIDVSNEVISKATKLSNFSLVAKAFNVQAKAYYALKNKKAKNKFESSNHVLSKHNLTNKPLMLENYNYLKLIANLNNDIKTVTQIDESISKLNTTNKPTVAVAPKATPIPIMSKPTLEPDKNKIEKEKLEKLTKEMQDELAENAVKFDAMSQDQLKSKLMLEAQEKALMNVKFNDSLIQERMKIQDLTLSESESKRNFLGAALAFLFLLCGGSIYLFLKSKKTSKLLEEKNKMIEEEREKSENLLLNILPGNVVQELKDQGYSNARQFEKVCVSFLDFVSFSKISEKYDPQTVLNDLNNCFKAFDEILNKYQLEKIKTIGDCYMFAGGLSDSDDGQQVPKMVKAAKDMISWLESFNKDRTKKMLITYEARVGIHAGPVAAGVVGTKKFLYDIWGDTVNIAARMEQNSEPNRINISHTIYEEVANIETCKYRGEIEAKNKGLLKMYFVENK